MARPETSETSCSADGPPSSDGDRHAVQARRPPSPTSRRRTRSRTRARRRVRDGRSQRPARPAAARRAAVPSASLTMKLACFSLTDAPPTRMPFRPSSSMSAPADGPSAGLRKTLPAEGMPSGWCAWRQRRISSSRRGDHVRVGRLELEGRPGDDVGGSRAGVLQLAVAVAQAEAVGVERRLGPVGRAGRTPRPAPPARPTRARRRWPTRRRRPCPGWPARTRGPTGPRPCRAWPPWPSAGPSRRSSDCPRSGPAAARFWMTRPRDAGVADDQVRAAAEDELAAATARARSGRWPRSSNRLCTSANRSAGPPTRIVVKRRERLVARCLDADAALDVGAQPGQLARRRAGAPSRLRAACRHCGGASEPLDRRPGWAAAAARPAPGPARPPRRPRRAGRSRRAGRAHRVQRRSASSSTAAASSSASASKSSSGMSRAAPASASARALRSWCAPACG